MILLVTACCGLVGVLCFDHLVSSATKPAETKKEN